MLFKQSKPHRVKKNLSRDNELDDAYFKIVQNQQVYQDDLNESVSVILRECARALSVSRASLWLLSEDQLNLECLSLYDSNENEFHSGSIISADSFPKYFDALINSRFIDAHDAFEDPRTNELKPSYLKVLDVRSLLDATIRDLQHKGQIQGVLCTEMVGEKREWTANEKTFVASIADLLSQRLIVSQLEISEARYRALYENVDEGFMIFNEGKVVDVNPAMCAIFGGNADDFIGKSPGELSPEYQPNGELSLPQAIQHTSACLAGQTQIFEWRHSRLDGSEFDAEVTLTAMRLLGENTFFAMIRDITSKKEAKALEMQNYQLEKAKNEAEEIAKSKTEFLANMSHEIRTPMNGIFGMVSLVLDTPLNSEQKDYVETIQSSTESLLTILNDILEYSKLSNSEIILDRREFNPSNLVNDVVQTFRALAAKNGLDLYTHIQPDLPSLLVGDDHRIRQILVNLVGNAVKFTHKGEVRIKVKHKFENQNERCICFSISDTGIGMSQEVIEKLFQPFTQADASITRNFGGTGLGLAISHDLAVAMGAQLTVESEVDQGTTFCFKVCLHEPNNDSVDSQDAVTNESSATIKELADDDLFKDIPILIVEDNLINQKVTSSILSKLGYPVTIASNGKEAVNLCHNNDYSIILMDLSMPEMDGFEATERIRRIEKKGQKPRIIAVSGHAFLEHRQRCEQVGIDDFLTKPYNLFKLKEKLNYVSPDSVH